MMHRKLLIPLGLAAAMTFVGCAEEGSEAGEGTDADTVAVEVDEDDLSDEIGEGVEETGEAIEEGAEAVNP
jgi:predicted small secreted protein